MEQRVQLQQTQPTAWKALYAFSGSLSQSSLSPIQRHLITLRVSQINSCAFCINMHSKEALQSGETPQRLFLLSAWKETLLFTPEEKAILALAEDVTLIHQHGVSDETYKQAAQFFTSETIGDIILLAVLMNAWNRVAVSTQMPVGN